MSSSLLNARNNRGYVLFLSVQFLYSQLGIVCCSSTVEEKLFLKKVILIGLLRVKLKMFSIMFIRENSSPVNLSEIIISTFLLCKTQLVI